MTTATTITCPSWCDGPTNPRVHNDSSTHIHEIRQESGEIYTSIFKRIDDGSWLVPVPLTILADLSFRGDLAADDLTAADCRELAAALLITADELDRINSEVTA